MGISPETIEEIERVANTFEIISDYIPLEKVGSNYKALCPFHSEKTPSFIVSPSKNIFKCFGCGKAGNGISFLMEYKGLSFNEALIEIARKYNIPIKYIGNKNENKNLKGLYDVIQKVSEFYIEELKKSPIAKKYLLSREIRTSTIEKFGIGYSPENVEKILQFAEKEKISIEDLIKIGVLKKISETKYIDRFKNRIIFPIRNHLGKIVAFGGRGVEKNQTPKYINSPETDIYSKSKVLYGYFESKDYLREKKTAIVVEGYFDLISLYQVGIKNVVATLGTALTKEQAKLLKKFVNKVILMFDSDNAGKKALISGAKILLSQDIDVYYCQLDEKDPDDLAKKGKKVVEEKLNNTLDIFEFFTQKIDNQESIKEKEKLINLYLELISYIPNKTRVALLIKNLSKITGINEKFLELKFSRRDIKENDEAIYEKAINKLSVNEIIILKTLLTEKDKLLQSFKDFDKIESSVYFMNLVNRVLNGEEIEDEIKEKILNSPTPSNLNTALKILNKLHRIWKIKELKLALEFNQIKDEKETINIINKTIKTL